MKWYVLLPLIVLLLPVNSSGQDTTYAMARIIDGDTVPIIQLPEVWVFAPMEFKNKREERDLLRFWSDLPDHGF